MTTAYMLRGGGQKGIALAHIGSFAGSLFIRSSARADRVYAAMKCRGYSLQYNPKTTLRWTKKDILFLALVWGGSCLFRFVNVPLLIGSFVQGALPS